MPDISDMNSGPDPLLHFKSEDGMMDSNRLLDRSELWIENSKPTLLRSLELENAVLLEDLMSCTARSEALKAERDEMDRERRLIESLEKVPQATRSLLSQLTREMGVLKKRLADRTVLEQFLCIHNGHEAVPPSHCFTTYFAMLNRSIDAVLVVNGSHKPSIGIVKGSSTDLDGLLSTLFGPSIESEPETIPTSLLPLTLYELIRALVGAAIYTWIFASDFRTPATVQTPILHSYRHLIKSWCT
jgi:hypothetical protein